MTPTLRPSTKIKGALCNQTVLLRALEPEDIELLYTVENDMSGWISSDTIAPYSRDALMRYLVTNDPNPFVTGQIRLVIEDCKTGDLLGLLDFYEISHMHHHCKVGIYVLESKRRRGFAKAAIQLGVEYVAEWLDVRQLLALVCVNNEPSIHLFRSVGFHEVGTLRNWHKSLDVSLFQLSTSD